MQKFAIMRSNCRLELGFPRDNDLLFHVISKKKTSNLLARFCGTFEVGRGRGGGCHCDILGGFNSETTFFIREKR